MKVITLFGTRPEIIRLSQVIKVLDRYCQQTLVHTGQNYDPTLSDVFFGEFEIRGPDFYLGVQTTHFAEQAGQILVRTGEVLEQVRPDRILILGDTNSGLAAIVAARMGIPVYHMEAGNRCYDDRVPEEINRRIIDHCSTVLMPYTHRSKENLLNEGVERERIFVIGNPINEVLLRYATRIDESKALESLGLGPEGYVLGTVHRAENVDDPTRLRGLWNGLCRLPCETGLPVILSLHPRTRSRLQATGLEAADGLRLLPPLGFFDFVHLEKHAALVVTDSGTVQEECAILGIRNVTVRDVTERAETLECGSNLLAGGQPDSIVRLARTALQLEPSWIAPEEYRAESVSQTVARILLGYR